MKARRAARLAGLLPLLLAVPMWSQDEEPLEKDLVVRPPEIDYRTPLTVRPDELPEGAGAQLPVRDMDPLLVVLPSEPTSDPLDARDIYDDAVAKVLRAVGFPDPELRLRFPPDGGVRRPRTDYRRLADALLPPDAVASWGAILAPYGMDESYLSDAPDDILYPFVQVVDAVPVEYSFVVASRRGGETVHAVSGSLLHNYEVVSDPPSGFDREIVVELATRAFAKIGQDFEPARETVLGEPTLVLLPYGNAGQRVALRYAWRMTFNAAPRGSNRTHRFQLWVDADPTLERVLKMNPLTRQLAVSAKGRAWNRQPNRPPKTVNFEVDAALGGAYRLQLAGAFEQLTVVDANGDQHAIQAAVQTQTLAEFFRSPPSIPGCPSNGHIDFAQVSLFATLHRNLHIARLAGLYPEVPSAPWAPEIDFLDFQQCTTADSSLLFSACKGYFHPECPTYSDDSVPYALKNSLSFADDNTVVAHEMGHNIVQGFTNGRPDGWCGSRSCPIVLGFATLHDLADAWADGTEGTNCTGGWVARNQRGSTESADCDHHSEKLPRKHEVSWPPGSGGDRFPQARRIVSYVNPYIDTQIAAAALWQVRDGMISKAGMLGPALYLGRLAEALLDTGQFSYPIDDDDIGIYELLWDLERRMALTWSADPTELGASTTNKVTAGFAKAGLFLVPSSCVDGLGGTCRSGRACNWNCYAGDTAADAVIDIEDSVPGDALVIDGLHHEENDFLDLRYGNPPRFLVWTGPEYSFHQSGEATPLGGGHTLCNSRVKVELSFEPQFVTAYDSDWINLDPGSRPFGAQGQSTSCSRGKCWIGTCYLEWTPEPEIWRSLIDAASERQPRIYYRALTTDAANGNRRSSTRPGNGLITVPPPYAILTYDGRRP